MNTYEREADQGNWFSSIFGFFYGACHILTVVLTFFGCWIYAIVAYGWFLGLALGWIPSLIIALIVGVVFPIIFFLILAGVLLGLIAYLK